MRVESLKNSLLLLLSCLSNVTVTAKTVKVFAQNVGLLVDTRLDPLVNPGTCSSHVHSVYGNAQFGATVDEDVFEDDDWRNTEGKINRTTSELTANLSLYWAPSLYIWDGQEHHLVPSFARPYYRMKVNSDGDRSKVHPFPKFLRLIVGDASRKNAWEPQDTDRGDIRWTLTTLNRGSTNYLEHGDWSYLLDNSAVADRGQVEMNLNFPECLEIDDNGTPKTESIGFRSHAASSLERYDSSRQSFCPVSHPYQIPRLNLEVRYSIGDMRDRLGEGIVNNVRNWRLSTNDSSGAGAHADFISGWPQDMMENIIANCTDGKSKDGGDADCMLEGFELDSRVLKSVPFNNPVPQEHVKEVTNLPTGNCPPIGFTNPPIGCTNDPNLKFRNKIFRDCSW
eukprot:CAMPEP_0198265106 /NCGR_PEP_ID=MMETSP1447-20131203/20280_1 /TAXON_ID=420782 /ORGANISM="Chaetoceros dichaeta, Strain CCMP1751" /LENGTH=394 /DNA_ID=CAMNT_0043954395 /DNA_START=71 /DNA_END=1252 /DNA_ORIENTATION=-